ncbi:MAG: fructose-specific PTS transporter subunit EIIC [Lachnospiraceae bacterium]
MKITDLLKKESIELHAAPVGKDEALRQAVSLMEKSGNIKDRESYEKQVFAREEEGTTGIGEGIAIPHGKCEAVTAPGLAAMVIPDGVEFDSLDGEPVHLLFLIAAPNTKDNVHLDVLSRLSVLLMDEKFADDLKHAGTAEEFLEIINCVEAKRIEEEAEKEAKDKEKSAAADAKNDAASTENGDVSPVCRILAVTACPTGIAHTYMAAESLEKAAKARNCFVKVETRGSAGAKNVLTAKEIAEADCIIVAADTKVPMERFAGKKVIVCQVSDGIGKADKLVERAINGDVSIYKAGQTASESDTANDKGSVGHQIYMHLMNGVSHMLPFVVGGGILIAIAFLLDSIGVDMASLSAEERGNFGTITPAAAVFKNIGGLAFGFMLPILAGYIAMSIADRPGLAAGFIGGAIAANGKSGFLGALAAGFIAGYLVLLLKKLFEKLPKAIEKLSPVLLFPLFGILFVGLIMIFVVEPPIGALNTALNDALAGMGSTSKLVLGAVLAGMMAIDMGGPFNKAAYVFGTASIIEGNYAVMAAVMIGGMVPPCAIALATLLFKNKFTKAERESGPTNFIMGLAFITEGAIPFAASDPLRVIPSCIIGSAAAGALSMAFGCTLMAPHGGIFVFPVVEHALMYLVALAVGTVISALLLGVLKKKVK